MSQENISESLVNSEALDALTSKLDEVLRRQDYLERRLGDIQHSGTSEHVSSSVTGQSTQPTPDSVVDIQGEFQSVRDSLQRIRLPPDLKLNESKRGVKASDRPHFNAVCRSARYVETCLKVLAAADDSDPSRVDIDAIFVVSKAHMQFLQDEHAAIVVQGQFDSTTSRFVRALQSNRPTSGLSETALDSLRNATSIATAAGVNNRDNNYQRLNFNRGRRFYGNYKGRGNYNNDVYSQFVQRPFPSQNRGRGQSREDHDE